MISDLQNILELISAFCSIFVYIGFAVFLWHLCSYFLACMNAWRVQQGKKPFSLSECRSFKISALVFALYLM